MRKLAYNILLLSGLFTSCEWRDKAVSGIPNFDTTFNSQMWKNGDLYLRGRMVKDLVSSHQLTSIQRDSLYAILGRPLEEDIEFCNYIVSSEDTSVNQNYLLLHVRFDSTKSIVVDYWLTD